MDAEMRKVAARRVRIKREFYMHLASYVIVNAALVAVWAVTGAGYPWFVWPLIGWGVGVAFHGFSILFGVDPEARMGPRDERAIARGLARLRQADARR